MHMSFSFEFATPVPPLLDLGHHKHTRPNAHVPAAALCKELGVKLVWTINTHCHADHITVTSCPLHQQRTNRSPSLR
jgi:hypothetical protein